MPFNEQIAEVKISKLELQIENLERIMKSFQIRTYVAETAIAYLVRGEEVDLDTTEIMLTAEFGLSNKANVREAVKELRNRIADPTKSQKED